MIGTACRSISAIAVVGASPAAACTLCHSNIAEQVRAAMFGADFWSNASAAPIPLLLGLVLLVARRPW
jgi:hypothetical protein